MPAQQPLLMGILNLTPDSFSDGGKYLNAQAALEKADAMVSEGADILDLGGESTRPGAKPVDLEEERKRVLPILEKLVHRVRIPISIDTTKFELAQQAVECGASIINDISGGADIRLLQLLVGSPTTQIVLMHKQGTPEMMQEKPEYPQGVVSEVQSFLKNRVRAFEEVGILKERIWVDPGIGFGKTLHHNLDLLRHLNKFVGVGGKLLIGSSRKSFISQVASRPLETDQRLTGSLTSNLWAISQGAGVVRIHDVFEMKQAIRLWKAIEYGRF